MAASRNGWGLNLAWAKIPHRAGNATAAAMVLALGLLTAMAFPAAAQTQGVYTVRDVAVDATAENAARAREVALSQGQQKALRQLLERLTPSEVHGSLPTPPADQVETMVLGLSVRNEKTSTVRYLADMTVRFVPQAIQSLLEQSGLPFVDEPAPLLVVLPVWKPAPDSPPVLWEDPNPWRQAWANMPRGGLQPTEAPLGDLQDVMAVEAANALTTDPGALAPVAERYGAAGVLIAEAVLVPGDAQTSPTVRVSARSERGEVTAAVQPRPGEDLQEGLRRAAQSILDQLALAWKERRAMPAGPSGQMTALVPIGSLHDWLSVRRALNDARGISSWTLQALTRDRAQVTLEVRGDAAQLAEALAPYGLVVVQEAGYWVIERGTGQPQAPATPQQSPMHPQPGVQTQPGMQPAPQTQPQEMPAADSVRVGGGTTQPR